MEFPVAEGLAVRYVLSLKHFAFSIFENYGGLAFVPQSRVVGLFLADVARVEQELAKRQGFDSMKAALEWQQLREEAASERERSTSADIGR